MKNFRVLLALWAPFVGASMLTLLAHKTLWATAWYWVYLSLLGILSGVLAARVLFQTGLKRWPIVGVM